MTSILTVLEHLQVIGCRNLDDFVCQVLDENLTGGGPAVENLLLLFQLSGFERHRSPPCRQVFVQVDLGIAVLFVVVL